MRGLQRPAADLCIFDPACLVGVVRQEVHGLVKRVIEVEASFAEHGDGIQDDFVQAGDADDC